MFPDQSLDVFFSYAGLGWSCMNVSMKKHPCFLVLFVLLSVIPGVLAALEWEKEEQTLSVHPLQLMASACFPFKNVGTEPVEIIKANASCGCLVPTLSKKTFAPGESGKIDVQFLLRGRTGKQRKHVMVTTSANPTVPYRLTLSVDIPDSYIPSSKRLIWERTPVHAPQTCRLVNKSGTPIKLGEVQPTVTCIKAELKPIKSGYEYDLIVTPDPGIENLRAYITIKTIPPVGMKEAKDYKVYIFIK